MIDSRTVLNEVMMDLEERTARGIAKYGIRLESANLSDRELLQHAYEEALDLAQYLKTLLMKN